MSVLFAKLDSSSTVSNVISINSSLVDGTNLYKAQINLVLKENTGTLSADEISRTTNSIGLIFDHFGGTLNTISRIDENFANLGTENVGISFCKNIFGGDDEDWKLTSDSIRGNVAFPGMKYLTNQATLGVASTDIFIEEKPNSSWVLDSTVAEWKAP